MDLILEVPMQTRTRHEGVFYRRSRTRRWLGALLTLTVVCALASPAQLRVVGYYPAWQRTTLPASSLRFEYLTHVIQAFAWPLADGSITGYADLSYPELVSAAHVAGRKVMVSCGGWGNCDGFGPMTADSTSRARFVSNLVDYLTVNGLDGVDIDWEPLSNAMERVNLAQLVRDIRMAFDQVDSTWLLTVAIPAGSWGGQWLDVAAMAQFVDWYNVMTYDMHGSWTQHAGHNSPLFAPVFETDGSVDQSVRYYTQGRGISQAKLVTGIPFYAKEFTADSLYLPSTGCTDILYGVIPSRIASGWRQHWDATSHVPYLTLPEARRTVCYDDSLSVSEKCLYAVAGGLGGVMIWALGQDLVSGQQPLLESIGTAMQGATDVAQHPGPPVPGGFRLEQNYPNPFNPQTRISYSVGSPSPQGPAVWGVRLAVYDLLGRTVAVLVDEAKGVGSYTVDFDASGLAGGVYVCRLAVDLETLSRKMVLVR